MQNSKPLKRTKQGKSPKPSKLAEETAKAAREAGNCVCFNVRKTARLISQSYDRALKPHGLNTNQFSILALIGAVPEPQTLSDTARVLGMDRTTLSRNLRHLNKAGLAQTLLDGQDARTRRLALTDKGWTVLAAALPSWRAVQGRTLAAMGPKSWPALRQQLDHLGQATAMAG
ncbi:MAG: MarR family winged helix-turn-helix transcriptional regulator [Robiginitomaculum sp.]|nr:MarR family winged helix-turn-helix transcriptional regulator [Robiginitomaculum sp.]MDQ7077869.1 MarR family winged helix-turn-helix transcriptional regulator [Robiginitomaculum sp.]